MNVCRHAQKIAAKVHRLTGYWCCWVADSSGVWLHQSHVQLKMVVRLTWPSSLQHRVSMIRHKCMEWAFHQAEGRLGCTLKVI